MDEQAVRAAADRIEREAHGLYMGTGEQCQMVPVAALTELFRAVDGPGKPDAPPAEATPTAEPPAVPLGPGSIDALILNAPQDVPTDRPNET